MMKLMAKIALVSALVVPALAGAAAVSGNTAYNSFNFYPGTSNVGMLTIHGSDLAYTVGAAPASTWKDTSYLGWALDNNGYHDLSAKDLTGNYGTEVISLTGLTAGQRTLNWWDSWSNIAGLEAGSALVSAGSISDSVAAVPEPLTYAMMLAGMMMMGAIASRRGRRS